MGSCGLKTDPIEFSHTYLSHQPIDEDVYDTFLLMFTSKEYRVKTQNGGFIIYEALDESHAWRINLNKNKFGHFEAEIQHPPWQLFKNGLVLI
jgi:hypothetical protein